MTTCTETFKVFVKRYFLLASQNTSHQLWRIPGGGGIPISTLESEATRVVAALNGSVSIYVTDKRSVGQSSFLECPTSIMANFSACQPFIQQYQYRLKHNTFTNTAHDLQYVLKVINGESRQSKSNQRVILMGSSQGTYLLQRYLHLMEDDNEVDGIILDAVLPTDTTRLENGDTSKLYIFGFIHTMCSRSTRMCMEI